MTQDREDPADDALEVLKFTYQDKYPLRVLMRDGIAFFVAHDISEIMGCSMMNVLHKAGARENDGIRVDPDSLIAQPPPLHISSGDGVWLIPERRFYEVAAHYDCKGWPFKRWVMHEVLPTIRHLNLISDIRTDLPVAHEPIQVLRQLVTPEVEQSEIPTWTTSTCSTKTHALYRFFDAKDRLLYVGESWNAVNRAKQHRRQQHWWMQVRRMTVEMHPSREAARVAEAKAIRTERPRYNRVGSVKPKTRNVPLLSAAKEPR